MKMNSKENTLFHQSRSVERITINDIVPETSTFNILHPEKKQHALIQDSMNL